MSKSFEIIDFHSHIIPHLDHGCKNSAECQKQLSLMKGFDTDIAVATPHFYPHEHSVTEFISRRTAMIERLRGKGFTKAPKIVSGAEVLLCPNLNKMDSYEKLCIQGTSVMLVELPFTYIDESYYRTLESIIDDGITVLLAHLDRYLYDDKYDIDALLDMGAYVQINASSLALSKIRKSLLAMLEHTDKLCALGSDLHGTSAHEYKKFVKAQKLLGDHYPTIMERSLGLLDGAQMIDLTE